MNYTDFPILNNHEYELIKSQYTAQKTFNRKNCIFKICNELNNCKNICYSTAHTFNFKIRNSLDSAKLVFSRLHENLASTFNTHQTKTTSLGAISLFAFINKINSIIKLTTEWSINEEKTYYKNIAQKTTLELLGVVNQIVSALENSNVFLFKHM